MFSLARARARARARVARARQDGLTLVAFGGTSGRAFLVWDDLLLYDVPSGRWSAPRLAGAAPGPRYRHSACPVPGGGRQLLIWGGYSSLGNEQPFADVHVLDIDLLAWTQPAGASAAATQPPRALAAAADDAAGEAAAEPAMNTAAAAAVVDLYNGGDDDDEPDDAAPPGVVMIRGSIVEPPPRDEPRLAGEAPPAARARAGMARGGEDLHRAEAAAARTPEVRGPADSESDASWELLPSTPATAAADAAAESRRLLEEVRDQQERQMQAMAEAQPEAPAAAEEPGAGAPGAASAGSTLAGGAQAAPAADAETAAEGLEAADATTTDPVPGWHPIGVGGHSACFIGDTPKILVFGGGFINDEDIEEDVNQVSPSPPRIKKAT